MYCQHCGNAITEAAVAEDVAEVIETEAVVDSAVRIAEIEASRDIKLAQIQAGTFVLETEVDLARAQARANAAEDVAEAMAPEPEVSAPVVIVADSPAEDAAEADALPPVEDAAAEPEAPKYRGYGNPAIYG